MKTTPTPPTWLASLFAFVAASNPLLAQSVAPLNEPVVELSPFVVNSTKDTGYQAMSTMAGTRLDTPLKDLGASISIYARDFLTDIGATTTNELLVYATGMDAAGPGGNYSGAVGDINSLVPVPDGYRQNPQGTSRARGLGGPTFTRDFFGSIVEVDNYNVDRVTVVRGANSVLIGAGSPAGVVDTAVIRADLQQSKNTISARLDNNMGLRTSVDFNRVLLPGKLAVRLAGLQAREEYNQRPAFEQKERLFGALTYKPFASTVLRANFETGHSKSNRPMQLLPSNSVNNDWLAAGRPAFDWTFYDDPVRNPLAASQNAANFVPYYAGQYGLEGPDIYFFNNPTDKKPSLILQSRNLMGVNNDADLIKDQLFHPLLNRDMAQDGNRIRLTQNISEMAPGAYWIGGNVLPGQQAGVIPPGLKQQGFLNFDAFNWEDEMIDRSGRQGGSLHTFNFSLEQRGWDNRVGIEVVYDEQRADRENYSSYFSGAANNHNHVRIDINTTLPNGLPNPNLGRPNANSRANNYAVRNQDRRTAFRATGFLKYDFKDLGNSWARWLGRHTATVLYQLDRADSIYTLVGLMDDGPVPNFINPTVDTRAASAIVYMGPSLIGNTNPLKLSPIDVLPPFEGPQGVPLSAFRRQANATDPGAFVDGPVGTVPLLRNGLLAREVIESQAVVLQSYWLNDHIVTVGGWRKDADHYASRNVSFASNPANLNDTGKIIWGFEDFNFPNTPPEQAHKETTSYSVVGKWPQKLLRLPAGWDLSAFFNFSQNFTPSGARVDFFNRPLPMPRGKTKEYGLNLFAFGEKLVLRVSRFETGNTDLSYGSAATGGVVALPGLFLFKWHLEGNINPNMVASSNADIATLMKALPSNWIQLYNFKVSGAPPSIAVSYNNFIPGATDTTDVKATGVEYELVYNPTSNWRILANVAHQQTKKSNSLPFTKAYAAMLAPVIAQLANRPGDDNYPPGYQPGQALPPTIRTVGQYWDSQVLVPLSAEAASDGFPSVEQRDWRVNIVANYTFGNSALFGYGEKLKGWSVGGGYRWQSKFVMGFPSSRLANGIAAFDLAHPYWGPADSNADVWVSYGRKIWDRRIDWKVQLNVTNLYQSRNLVPIGAQPWGQVAWMRLAPARRWYLNNTFSF